MTASNAMTPQDRLAQRHRRVAVRAGGVAVIMLGLAFAAVPLYQMFCQVTGFGGTTRRVVAASTRVVDRLVTVRFDANVAPGLGWRFEPVERTMKVKLGETSIAVYRATNISDRELTGTASFNVAPDIAGGYFNKLECFCFTEQTLKPGQSVDMPVSFYVDPAIVENPDSRKVQDITLSYTFFHVPHPTEKPGKGS